VRCLRICVPCLWHFPSFPYVSYLANKKKVAKNQRKSKI
jgi:hypothetical protein